VLALIERDGALLLGRRSDRGRWGLIGGAVDAEEALEEALRRETRTETGLEVKKSAGLFRAFPDPPRIVRVSDGNVVRLISFGYTVAVEGLEELPCSEESEGCGSSAARNSRRWTRSRRQDLS
jgi:8-oxo-dGTP pyrophosphatase MutT (NUDIX family)